MDGRTGWWPWPGRSWRPPGPRSAGPSRTPSGGGRPWSWPAPRPGPPAPAAFGVGGGRELLGRPPDLRAADGRRRSRWARAWCGRTGGPWPRRRPWPRASGGTRPSGVAPASRSTAGRWPPRSPGSPPIEPGRLAASDWLLSPRDLVVWRLTGEVAHRRHAGLAHRSLRHRRRGGRPSWPARPPASCPPWCPRTTWPGPLRAVPAAELGLRAGDPGGDRGRRPAVRGARGRRLRSSARWSAGARRPTCRCPRGTDRPDPPPAGAVVSRGADGGWLLEGGLSAAGSFLAWLGRVCGRDPDDLARLAAESPPGARGVVAVPWLDGARAPWWRDDARAGFVGLASAHDAGDLARAVVESVAWEVARCLEAVTSGRPGGPPAGGPHPGRCGDRRPAVGGRPHLGHRAAGHPPALGRGGLGRRRPAGGLGAIGRALPLDQLDPVDGRDRARPRRRRPATGRCARWPTAWPGRSVDLGLGAS